MPLSDDEREKVEQYLRITERLVHKDLECLKTAPTLPKLYESGVKYDPVLDYDECLMDVSAILGNARADIESLVAWRVADLRQQGIMASAYIKWRPREGGGHVYTMTVRMPDGTEEDVVARLREKSGL